MDLNHNNCVFEDLQLTIFSSSISVGMSPNLPGSPNQLQSATNIFGGPGMPNAHAIGALVSQHRLLELSRFGLRGYDLAQHMLTQQGAVSKLLGEYSLKFNFLMIRKFDFITG